MQNNFIRKKPQLKFNKNELVKIGFIAFYTVGIICVILMLYNTFKIYNNIRGIEQSMKDHQQAFVDYRKSVNSEKEDAINERDEKLKELEERVEKMLEEAQAITAKELTTTPPSRPDSYVVVSAVQNSQFNDGRGAFTPYTDLYTETPLSVEELDIIIDQIRPKVKDGMGTPFTGEMFYKAWQITGLDPRYLLAHSGNESGWGHYHLGDKYQMYGIGVWDDHPEYALKHGNSVEEGIINGAKWIKENYYNKGYTTMYLMGKRGYCAGSYWYNTIAGTANRFVSKLNQNKTEYNTIVLADRLN